MPLTLRIMLWQRKWRLMSDRISSGLLVGVAAQQSKELWQWWQSSLGGVKPVQSEAF
jgi:hypothetical protein